MIDMVNQHAWTGFYDIPVHVNGSGDFSCGGVTLGVKGAAVFGDVPFVSVEPIEVVGVNDCKFALGERYAAERIAVTEAAIQKERED
jgi:hypothetical protein